jgi:hypothetical protein
MAVTITAIELESRNSDRQGKYFKRCRGFPIPKIAAKLAYFFKFDIKFAYIKIMP